MSNIRPINQSHSITEVIFVLQFARELEQQHLRMISDLDETLSDHLPKKQEVTALDIQIQNNQLLPKSTKQILAEVKFSHHLGDGSADWILRATRRFIGVSCFAYDRWHNVWPQAGQLLRLVAHKLVTENTPVGAIGLQYIDRFLYTGDYKAYTATDLFNPVSPYLSKHTLSSGPTWHLHQGWFDPEETHLEHRCRILNRLNINTAQLEGEHQTTIDHQLSWQFFTGVGSPRSIASRDGGHDLLDFVMTRLHDVNKEILRSLLNEEILKRIHLNASE